MHRSPSLVHTLFVTVMAREKFRILSLFTILTALLLTPILFSSYRFDSWPLVFEFCISTTIIVVFLTALRHACFHFRSLSPIFWLLLVVIFVIRLTWFLVVDFSGEGFTDNFYAHINVQALHVAFREYSGKLLLALMLLTLTSVAIVLLQPKSSVKSRSAFATITVALLLFYFIPYVSIEQQLLYNYLQFQDAIKPGKLSPADVIDLEQSGLVKLGGNEKSEIIATPGATKKNLILMYLESFHLAFTDDGPLPDLTPNINRLKREYGHHSNWLSSADQTMEAIISTQCGALISSPQGSNTFANTHSILPRLACLPDVLHEAGYYQVFFGGFDKHFSGKNLFFTEHGYDEVTGWEDWQQRGFANRDGYWGLSDEDLFEQATERIRAMVSTSTEQPFNLTLLTLSTHPPGFSASSCTPYATNPNGSRLLEAIHCTDQLVGRFVRQMQSGQLLENTTLVIIGDHDIFNLPEVREHFPNLDVDPRLLNIIIDPDLLFSYPEQVNVAYDLAPTLLDILQVDHNTQFTWGISVFARRNYHVSRRFRGPDTNKLDFHVTANRECRQQQGPLTIPLDDCEHNRLLSLSDKYLYGFYDEEVIQPGLCNAEQDVQVEVGTQLEPVSIRFMGAELANSFAHKGRPLVPTSPGFYLFIKASHSTAPSYNFYGLDHVYWQMRLVDTLMELNATDQLILVYKPNDGITIIEPLERLMRDYGFSEQDLTQPFVVITNGNPGPGQVFLDRGDVRATLTLSSADCTALIKTETNKPVLDKPAMDTLLTPYKEKYPDI